MASNLNYKFPIQRTSNLGFIEMTSSKLESVGNNIMLMLTTNSWERFDSDVTNGLQRFLFENINSRTAIEIDQHIRSRIKRFFPNVNILLLTITTSNESTDLLSNQVVIDLRVGLINDPNNALDMKVVVSL